MNQAEFSGRLLAGEHIVWSGPPGQGLLLTARDAFLVPFSLVWCGFAIFWTATVTRSGAPGFFMLWGLMFVCIGLFFTVGRFIADAWLRSRTTYAVTDQRVLVLRTGPFATFTALSLQHLQPTELNERGDGRGTIRFGAATSMLARRNGGVWMPSLDPTPQFLAIENARRVFDLVQRAGPARPPG